MYPNRGQQRAVFGADQEILYIDCPHEGEAKQTEKPT